MKKLFNLLQWAFLIALVIFGIRLITRPVTPLRYHPETWASWSGFYALSYAGVTREGNLDYISPARLARQIEALVAAGYQTIFPEDALAFLEGRHPLPEKAVLLLFEGGRKDSYIHATRILRRTGVVATMVVPTAQTQDRGTFFLHPRELEKISQDKHWRLASMGHRAVETLPGSQGAEGHFLTQRMIQNGQPESDETYRTRVMADFTEASRILTKAGQTQASAYLFPFSDDGHSTGADPLAGEAIQEAVRICHPLAFTKADEAFNGPNRDPLQLSRIRVLGTWDAETLLAELSNAAPRFAPVNSVDDPDLWSIDGSVGLREGALRLDAGSRAWLRGSGSWSDAEIALSIRREPGSHASIYVRRVGPQGYVRLTISDDGFFLQEKLGRHTQTLGAWPWKTSGEHGVLPLNIRLRGNRMWVSENKEFAAGPIPLHSDTSHGQLGFEAESAGFEITQLSAHPDLGVVALVEHGYRELDDATRTQVSTVIAPWFDATREVTVSPEQIADLLAAAAVGVEVVPLIQGGAALDSEQAAAFAQTLAQALKESVASSLIHRLAIADDDQTLALALRGYDFGLVRLVESTNALAWSKEDRAARAGAAFVLLNADRDFLAKADRWQQWAPANRLALLSDDTINLPPGIRRAIRYERKDSTVSDPR